MPPATASSRAPSAWEWIQAGLLSVNLAWTTLCLGGYLASTTAVTWVMAGATLIVGFLAGGFARRPRPELHPAAGWLLPFLAYAAINAAWISPVPWLGWQDWFNWALALATFWTVVHGVRARGPRLLLFGALALLGVTAVLLACYQRFARPDWLIIVGRQAPQFAGRASGPFGIPNSLAAFLLLLLPASLALTLRRAASAFERVLFGWLTLVLTLGLGLTISRGGWIALGLALLLWPLVIGAWPWRRRVLVSLSVLVALWAGGVGLLAVAPKVRARYEMMLRDSGELKRPILWHAAWETFRAHPVVGSGAGSFNTLFERHRPEREQGDPRWAHNDYLNTLSDYGVVGGILLFGAAAAIAGRAVRSRPTGGAEPSRSLRRAVDDPLVVQGLAVGLFAFLVQLVFEFHFKIPALAMAFASTAGLWVSRSWRLAPAAEPTSAGRAKLVFGFAAGLVALGVAGWIVPAFRAEGLREASRRELDRVVGIEASATRLALADAAQAQLSRALEFDPGNRQAWADRAYALAIISHEQPERDVELGRLAERDARRALAGGNLVPEFWLRLGVSLDMQHRWLEAGDAFTRALELAPTTSQAWFYQAYHLSLNPVMHRLAGAAVETCLRLDPGSPEGQNLRRQLAPGPK